MKVAWVVTPGGLSASDRERIVTLAERGWKASPIARAISKHPSTVRWFMYRQGLAAPVYGKPSSMRGGRRVKPFDREEDAFIEALRVQSFGTAKIAKLTTARFGHPRAAHTIYNRLVMLAALDLSAEAAQ